MTKKDKHAPFSVIEGGKKDLPKFEDVSEFDNWLQSLNVGTVFLAREKTQPTLTTKPPSSALQEFDVDAKTEKSVKLTQYVSGQELQIWVDSLRFSRMMELVETI